MPQTRKRSSSFSLPAYRKVEEDLRARIRNGVWPRGAMLPGRKALALEYGVNLETIQRGIKELVEDGILVADARRGTFVAFDYDRLDAATVEIPAAASETQKTVPANSFVKPVEIGLVAHLEIRSGWIASTVNLKGLEAVEEASQHAGFICRSINLWRGPEEPAIGYGEAAKRLVSSGVSALVIMAGFHPQAVDYAALMDVDVPIAMISLVQERSLLPTVCYDHRDAGHLAAKHLLDQGCEQIVFFSPNRHQWALERRTGAREAMIMARRPPEELREWIVEIEPQSQDDREPGLKMALDWLDRRTPFDGIVAANDVTAIEFMEAAGKRGLVAGRDYGIVGFDDTIEARFAGLTSVQAPIGEMGREAVSLVAGLLKGRATSRRVTLHSKLVVRKSTVIN